MAPAVGVIAIDARLVVGVIAIDARLVVGGSPQVAMANQVLDNGEVINARWAFDDPNPRTKKAVRWRPGAGGGAGA